MHDAPRPDPRLAKLDGISRHPLTVSAPGTRGFIERRNHVARRALTQRVLSEFDEMPGTCLTLAQATRLFGVSPDICQRILNELIANGRLQRTADSRFRLSAA